MRRKIAFAHGLEPASAKNSSQTGEVFGHATENAKPILPIVDLETFEGTQTVVRLDVPRGPSAHASPVGCLALHAFRPREGLHHGTGNGPLESMELHTATASDLPARKWLAFKASL